MACYKEDVVDRRISLVFGAIVKFKREHNGNSPSLREIADMTDITTTSIVSYYLNKLERRGDISRGCAESRMIEVANSRWVYDEEK